MSDETTAEAVGALLEVATEIRQRRMGYKDGNSGTAEDVRALVDKLEADARSYAEGNATMHSKLSERDELRDWLLATVGTASTTKSAKTAVEACVQKALHQHLWHITDNKTTGEGTRYVIECACGESIVLVHAANGIAFIE